jgi:hypothetical protein
MLKKKYASKIKLEHIRSIIGCFFFLRYILPAIITPEIYKVIDEDFNLTGFDRTNLISVKNKFFIKHIIGVKSN